MYKVQSYQEIKENIEEYKKLDPNFFLKEQGIYFVSFENKLPLGYAFIRKEQTEYIVEYIYVKAEERYKSHGSKLIQFITNHAVKNRINNISVLKKSDAEKFFKKTGFKVENENLILSNIQQRKKRQEENRKTVLYSIFWNIVLAVVKISGGIFGKSRGLLIDGFNSLSDMATSFGILIGIHFSNMPEDEGHPYGHEKIESIISIGLGIFMILTAFELGKGSVLILMSGEERSIPQFSTIYLAAFSSLVKFFMYKQKMRVGIKTQNNALIADAKDSRNDVFSSLGVIVGILLSIYVSDIFDVLISLAVSALIFKEGVSVLLDTSDAILDKQDLEFISEIKTYIYQNTDIRNVHDIKMRNSGDKIFLTFHIRVPKNMIVHEAHEIADNLEESIMTDFASVKDVIIHLDNILDSE
ncbi:MAG: GNAT family N-acetyltransferase [Fusobacteriaceae bacterium]